MMGPMTDPRPFRIDVPDAVLDDLRERLARTRWPEPIPGRAGTTASNVAYLRELCDYWRDGYDWRAREARAQRVPAASCARSTASTCTSSTCAGRGPTPTPLLLIARLAGLDRRVPRADRPAHRSRRARRRSRRRVRRRRALAARATASPARRASRGWGVTRIADRVRRADDRVLGYERYGAQGGDWGAIVAAQLGAAASRARRRHPPQLRDRAAAATDAGPEDADAIEQVSAGARTRRGYQRPGHEARLAHGRAPTRPPGWRRGSSRSSGPGATATATSSARSPRTSC